MPYNVAINRTAENEATEIKTMTQQAETTQSESNAALGGSELNCFVRHDDCTDGCCLHGVGWDEPCYDCEPELIPEASL